MRYVFRDEMPLPAAFLHPAAHEARVKLLEFFRQGERKIHQTRFDSDLSRKGPTSDPDIHKALLALFKNRCAFCETPLVDPGVYRFRPVANAEPVEDVNVSHLYYSWLSEAWQNLYPICDGCRPDNPNYFPVTGKRSSLPEISVFETFVEWNNGRWPDFPLEERHVLLDPCKDKQIWRNLFFRSTGEIVGVSRRGRETIEHFHLDRADLIKGRQLAIAYAIERTEQGLQGHVVLTPSHFGHEGACNLFLREVLHEALGRDGNRDPNRQFAALSRLEDGLERFRAAISMVDERAFRDELPLNTLKIALGSTERPESLTSVSIRNFKSLEHIDLKLPLTQPGKPAPALLILGENATGKSTILEAVALAVMSEPALAKLDFDASNAVLNPKYLGAPDKVAPSEAEVTAEFTQNHHTTLTIQRGRGNLMVQTGIDAHLPVFAYGAYRQYLKGERKYAVHKHVRSLFHPAELLSNPERWLLKLGESEFKMVARALREVFSIEGSFDVLEKGVGKIHVVVEATDQNRGVPVRTPIELVSSGFRAVLAMLCDIMQGLMDARVNPSFESLDSAKALVLIDEVEAHLHPRWKMSIMTGLRSALPCVTFIATSHDPLCLRGMMKGEVMVLERISGDQAGTDLPVFTHGLVDLPDNENWTIEQLLTADFFQMRTTESLEAERRAADMEDRLAVGTNPEDDPELAAYLAELSADLPIGHTEVHRLVQEAIATFLRERRIASDDKLRQLRDDTRQSILAALRSVG